MFFCFLMYCTGQSLIMARIASIFPPRRAIGRSRRATDPQWPPRPLPRPPLGPFLDRKEVVCTMDKVLRQKHAPLPPLPSRHVYRVLWEAERLTPSALNATSSPSSLSLFSYSFPCICLRLATPSSSFSTRDASLPTSVVARNYSIALLLRRGR